MKKILILLALPLFFSACLKNDEDTFSKSAADRMDEAINNAYAVLKGAPNGWVMKFYPESERIYGGYTAFLKFNEDNTVITAAETASPSAVGSALYGIEPEGGPVFRFNTFEELYGFFYDPRTGADQRIGTKNGGLEGDADFIIMEATPEFVKLKGRKTQNYAYLTPLPEGVEWATEMRAYQEAADNMSLSFNTCTVNGVSYPVEMESKINNFSSRVFNIIYTPEPKDDKEPVPVKIVAPFVYTKTGIEFYKPVTIGEVTVSEMTLKEDYYLEDPTGTVKILSPAPIRSDNKFTITATDITFSSATINVTPTINNEYYIVSVYTQESIAEVGDKAIIRDILGELNSYVGAYTPEFVMTTLCESGPSESPFTEQFEASTTYRAVVVGIGIAADGKALVSTTDLAKKDFTTAEMPDLSDGYKSWLGKWTVTSTSAELTKKPVSFDVTISVKYPERTYNLSGWGTTIVRLEKGYEALGRYNPADQTFFVNNKEVIRAENAEQNLGMLSRYKSGNQYGWMGSPLKALTATQTSATTANMVGYHGKLSSGGEFTITCTELCYLPTDGSSSLWVFNPGAGYTKDNWPVGPYTMTKIGNLAPETDTRAIGGPLQQVHSDRYTRFELKYAQRGFAFQKYDMVLCTEL